jgi:hypothetical protein
MRGFHALLVTYRNMTPESRNSGARSGNSLLANGSPNTCSRSNEQTRKSIASQRFGKHVSVTTDRQQTFSVVTGSLYKEPCREERVRD